VIAVIATLALAAAPLGPTALVKSIDAEVQQVIKTPDASAKKLAQRIDEVIDFNEMSKRAMGANWAKLNKKQQDDLGTTMRGLLKASYENKAMKDKDGNPIILRKTLQLNYHIRGDDVYPGEDEVNVNKSDWVMR
jgi:ABC-type transporter MlaC component